MLLQRLDEIFLEIVRRQSRIGNFAQRHDGILVIITVYRDMTSSCDHARPMAREEHELKPVFDLVDAIFNGDAGHRTLAPSFETIWGLKLIYPRTRTGGKRNLDRTTLSGTGALDESLIMGLK
ncbi:protein of unknown function [Methylocella tundrae]|uniref:Uncharacterized protein n=1 Tax=Methylocella tundrae TaxID=227605 RepID=A0A4U8YY42_METTU|nr:protein of unknown function [Methylocella tundrae]